MYEERAKSLRWLAFNFPHIDNPQDDSDKMCNCINLYCTQAADAIEELARRNARWEAVVKAALDCIPCWVSVSDRLPEDGEDVLCRLLDDNCEVCATVGCYSSTFKLWDLDAEWALSRHVTHWMPLPALS